VFNYNVRQIENLAFSIKKINTKYYIWLSVKPKRIAYQQPYVSYTERCQQYKLHQVFTILTTEISLFFFFFFSLFADF